MRWISATTVSSVAAMRGCIFHGVVALDEIGRVAVAAEERFQFIMGNARQHRGTGNLVSVEDVRSAARHHRGHGIEKLVRVPTGGERAGFCFAIADDASDEQIGVVERRPECVRERISQLASFVDRTGRLRRDVTGNASGERELFE
jgi:hypothetical protein